MDPAEYIARLNEINEVEPQIETLEALSEEIEEAPVEVLPAVLAMMERVAGQSDFGLMHDFGDWMEELDGAEVVGEMTVAEHVLASLQRAVNFKTLEISPGLWFDEDLDRPADAYFAGLRSALTRPGITDEERDMIEAMLSDYASEGV